MLPMQQQMQLGNVQQQIPPPPTQQQIPNPAELSLAGVLHFLQTEWRRYERERNEWEIERAEMRARIALLEGERRSFENIKIDLLRRVKMMEYALRVERAKQLQQYGAPAAPGKASSIKDEPQNETAPNLKEGSGSNSPHSEDVALPNEARLSIGSMPNGTSAANKGSQQPAKESTGWNSGVNSANLALGKAPPGRDARSRARSRDYLKQCLLEVTYLTSHQAMNPLPNRTLLNAGNNNLAPGMQTNSSQTNLPLQAGLAIPNLPNFEGNAGLNGRAKKGGPDINNKDFPLANGNTSADRNDKPPTFLGVNNFPGGGPVSGALVPPTDGRPGDNIAQIITNPLSRDSGHSSEDEPTQLTAIFRPDDAGEWRERLRVANQEAVMRQNMTGQFTNMPDSGSSYTSQTLGTSGWDLSLGSEDSNAVIGAHADDEEDEGSSLVGDDSGKKWKVRKTLRNHLDGVRTIAFHPKEMILATGGDDLTVKIWRMDAAQLASTSAGRTAEMEPQVTLRGHSAAVTSLAIAPHRGLVYSASLDSTIRVWAIPPPQHSTYSPYEASTSRGELIGHTDAVWGLSLLRDGSMLVSCGADGMVKVWDVGGVGPGSLRLSWGYGGVGVDSASSSSEKDVIGACVVEGIKANLKWVAVGYRDGVVKIFDVETGKEVAVLQADGLEASPNSQVNAMVSHPGLQLLVVGYEDKSIRVFDLATFSCTYSMLTHLEAVTSLSIDPSGHSLVSGSHDNSVRFWDLLGQKDCVQEDTKHRLKGEEGVLAVQFHPSLPFMASAGADGLVKIWASS